MPFLLLLLSVGTALFSYLALKAGEIRADVTIYRRAVWSEAFWAFLGIRVSVAASFLGAALAIWLGWLPR